MIESGGNTRKRKGWRNYSLDYNSNSAAILMCVCVWEGVEAPPMMIV